MLYRIHRGHLLFRSAEAQQVASAREGTFGSPAKRVVSLHASNTALTTSMPSACDAWKEACVAILTHTQKSVPARSCAMFEKKKRMVAGSKCTNAGSGVNVLAVCSPVRVLHECHAPGAEGGRLPDSNAFNRARAREIACPRAAVIHRSGCGR